MDGLILQVNAKGFYLLPHPIALRIVLFSSFDTDSLILSLPIFHLDGRTEGENVSYSQSTGLMSVSDINREKKTRTRVWLLHKRYPFIPTAKCTAKSTFFHGEQVS